MKQTISILACFFLSACSDKDLKNSNLSTSFYDNGQKMEEGRLINEKKHGTWNAWYENGQLKGQGTFREGKSHGEQNNGM